MQTARTSPSSFESQLADRGPPVVHGECEHVPMSSVQPLLPVWQTPPAHEPLPVPPPTPPFALSLPIVSTQLLEQQLAAPHALVQNPQLFGSLVVSTHVLPQQVLCTPVHCPPQLPPPESCGVVPES